MFKLLSLVFSLVRELIFQNKDEYSFRHVNFNPRKYVIMIIICISLTMNVFTINDSLNLRTAFNEYKKNNQPNTNFTAPDSSCEDMVVRTRAVCVSVSNAVVKKN